MTEYSRPWAGRTIGDAGVYSDNDWDDIWEVLYGSGAAPYGNRGVIRNWANELEVTDPVVAGQVDVETGAALVHGKFYKNTAVVNVVGIPVSGAPWREDTILLRQVWATQTTRVYWHQNSGGDGVGYEMPASVDGTVWYIPLAAVQINAAGAIILITDLREFVDVIPAVKELFVRPFIPSNAVPLAVRYGIGMHEGVELDANGEYGIMEFVVPDDFKCLLSAHIRIIAQITGGPPNTIDWTAIAHWGACNEAYDANTDTTTQDGYGVVVDDRIYCIDVSAALDGGLSAGDQVGLQFSLDADLNVDRILLLGLDLSYR